MTTLTLGRVGLDVNVPGWSSIKWGRDRKMTISGELRASTTAAVEALIQQLNGYVDGTPWENYGVPFVWSGGAAMGGYVRVLDATISTVPASYSANWFPFTLTLERLRQTQTTKFEVRSFGANRPSIGGTSPQSWIGLPAAASAVSFSAVNGLAYTTRVGPGGTARFFYLAAGPPVQPFYNSVNSFTLAPDHRYDVAATIKAGSPLYAVVGQQFPSIGNEAQWELSNGLVRVTRGSTALLKVEVPVAGAPGGYGTSTEFNVQITDGAFSLVNLLPADLKGVVVVRNSPEECALMLVVEHGTPFVANSHRLLVTLSLRRGSRFVDLTGEGVDENWEWGVQSTLVNTWDAGTQYAIEHANNSDGNRWLLIGKNSTSSADRRVYTVGSVASFEAGIGAEIGGTGATAPEQRADLVKQWNACVSESPRLVRA